MELPSSLLLQMSVGWVIRIGTQRCGNAQSSVKTEDSIFVCKVDILLMNLILEPILASSKISLQRRDEHRDY